MNRRTLKIIGIAAAHLPLVLAVIVLICVIASIVGATQREPEKSPVYEYQTSFKKIDEAMKLVDEDFAQGKSNPPIRYYLYAVYLTIYSKYNSMPDSFYVYLIDLGYKEESTGDSITYVAVTDENELFERLGEMYRPVTETERQSIHEQKEMLSVLMAGKFLAPLLDQEYLQHVITEFGNEQSGMTISFSGIENLSVRAIDDGVVIESAYDRNLGNYVLLQHGDGYKSLYGHLYESVVKVGDTVPVGHILGSISDSGTVTTPCLYLEIRKNDVPVNPRPLFESRVIK